MITGRKICLLSLSVFIAVVFFGNTVSMAAQETIRVTCWEGYADQAFIDAFNYLNN